MTTPNTNLRAFYQSVHTLLTNPSQFLPHLTIPTITHLPEQLGPALTTQNTLQQPTTITTTEYIGDKKVKAKAPMIRALVLDKDNTLCAPKSTLFPPQVLQKLYALRHSPTSPFHIENAPHSILIVSNRAGSHPSFDAEIHEIDRVLAPLRIPVFQLPKGVEKKPFCGKEIVQWFRERDVVRDVDEIAVVGDRLGTDVVMAGLMGSWSVWCRDGVYEAVEPGRGRPGMNMLERMEMWVERYLRESRGLRAPPPRSSS